MINTRLQMLRQRLRLPLRMAAWLLLAATLALWCRSEKITDRACLRIHHISGTHAEIFMTSFDDDPGEVELGWYWGRTIDGEARDAAAAPLITHDSFPGGRLMFSAMGWTWKDFPENLGFRFTSTADTFIDGFMADSARETYVNFPFWCPATILGAITLFQIYGWLRSWRRRNPSTAFPVEADHP